MKRLFFLLPVLFFIQVSAQEPSNDLKTQPNGTGVYALRQDHMPCIAPDMSQFNMPVMGKDIKILGLPPRSLPAYEIIPIN
jgi:hypothetical protein